MGLMVVLSMSLTSYASREATDRKTEVVDVGKFTFSMDAVAIVSPVYTVANVAQAIDVNVADVKLVSPVVLGLKAISPVTLNHFREARESRHWQEAQLSLKRSNYKLSKPGSYSNKANAPNLIQRLI